MMSMALIPQAHGYEAPGTVNMRHLQHQKVRLFMSKQAI